MDTYIVTGLHSVVMGSSVLSLSAVFFAHYFPFLVIFASLLFIFSQKSRVASFIFIYGAVVIAMLVLLALQILVGRERPFQVIESIKSLIGRPLGSSFPSGHAVFFSAIASGIYASNKEIGLIFVLCALVIGIARIAVGVHWPTDILVGLVLGWILASIMHVSFFQEL